MTSDIIDSGPDPPLELITYVDAVATYGREFVDRRIISFHRHHDGFDGQPCWFADVFEDIIGLIQYELTKGADCEQHRPWVV